MSNIKVKGERLKVKGLFYFLSIFIFQFSIPSCKPEAPWTTKNVELNMDIKTVSAGFIECDFSTNKNAYYLIAIEEARDDYNPMAHQKEFMMLALDSANTEYIQWRHSLLKSGETNIAPFSSQGLQYGDVNHFFTGLWFEQKYWVYAFIVDPDKMQPVGKLYLQTVTTKFESIIPLRFDYRVKGDWDYIYPLDSTSGTINAHFPYITMTMDSVDVDKAIADEGFITTPQEYFSLRLLYLSTHPKEVDVLYGVSTKYHDGFEEYEFEQGHTYYTFIGGYDFSIRQSTLYKFRWEGEKTNLYFSLKDNIAKDFPEYPETEDTEAETEESSEE